jgi:hypothetical protein
MHVMQRYWHAPPTDGPVGSFVDTVVTRWQGVAAATGNVHRLSPDGATLYNGRMTDHLSAWIDKYRTAWESNDPDDIRALFTEDAEYRTEPYADPWRGHEEIVEGWVDAQDEPGETSFDWSPVVATAELGIAEAETVYFSRDVTYSNLWVVKFAPDGRAASFTEWWMEQDD